jgi:hypothetical protein
MTRILAFLALVASLMGTPALAAGHGSIYSYIATETGITVPPLIHGQMVALNDNRAAIVALAQQVAPDDSIATQLRGYISQQRAACLWGIMPLSIADTESPFHLCMHGYLAGTKALLMRMQDVAGTNAAVQALAEKVNLAILYDGGGGLALCLNSDTAFHTADIIRPQWADVPRHPVTLATFVCPFVLLFGALVWPLRQRRLRVHPQPA